MKFVIGTQVVVVDRVSDWHGTCGHVVTSWVNSKGENRVGVSFGTNENVGFMENQLSTMSDVVKAAYKDPEPKAARNDAPKVAASSDSLSDVVAELTAAGWTHLTVEDVQLYRDLTGTSLAGTILEISALVSCGTLTATCEAGWTINSVTVGGTR